MAVSSRTQERAARVAALCGADAIDDLYAPLERSDVDVVDICLPTPLHREAAERAFAAGKHVLLEKPIALTLEDAEAIVAAAERAGRLLVVGLVLRFWPEYVELRRIAASGELGRPLAASAQRLSPPPGWNDWMIDPARSGGVCVDLMVHDFDALLGGARPAAPRLRACAAQRRRTAPRSTATRSSSTRAARRSSRAD